MSSQGIKISEFDLRQLLDEAGFSPWIVNGKNYITNWANIKTWINGGIESVTDLSFDADTVQDIPLNYAISEPIADEFWYKIRRGTSYSTGKIMISTNGTTVLTDVLSLLGDAGNCGCTLVFTLDAENGLNLTLTIDNSDTNTVYLYSKLRSI
jgi:hypothetical protein